MRVIISHDKRVYTEGHRRERILYICESEFNIIILC